MSSYLRPLKQGLREGALVFVAPLVALFLLFTRTAYRLLRRRRS